MKRMLILSALTGVLTLTGCTTLNNVFGNDDSGMHDVQATNKNTAPVASKNGMLVDASNHMTLYTFDKDGMNKSECGSACLIAWPAFMAPSNAKASGQFAAFQREDGKYQWPDEPKDVLEISEQQLRWLTEGLTISPSKLVRQVHPHLTI